MTEKQAPEPSGDDRPREEMTGDLKEKRDAFLHTFFRRGAELTEELVGENKRLRGQLGALEKENADLKTQLASDTAIRDLLKKIDQLERDKARLLSTVHDQAEISNRFAEIESELESFANLYVAISQIHSSLRVRTAVRHLRELLVQLVGARSLAIYFIDDGDRHLLPIATDGVDIASVPGIDLREATAPHSSEAAVERAYLTGVAHVADVEPIASPAACIPLHLENRTVGVIVVYTLLEHKKSFIAVDRELFKLLGAHAGRTIVSAFLWSQTNGRLPSAGALRALCA